MLQNLSQQLTSNSIILKNNDYFKLFIYVFIELAFGVKITLKKGYAA